jgi:hypothetical protein
MRNAFASRDLVDRICGHALHGFVMSHPQGTAPADCLMPAGFRRPTRESHGFMVPLILLAILVLRHEVASAQTISIVNLDHSREAIVMEAVLKRLLRSDGYTIQGSSTDGYVVLLHGMVAHTTQGSSVGVVGSAAVVKVLGAAAAAALLHTGSSKGEEFVGAFTAVMGSPLIYLAGTTAIGGDATEVAQVLSIYVNTVLQHPSFRASEVLRVLKQHATEQEPLRSPETER